MTFTIAKENICCTTFLFVTVHLSLCLSPHTHTYMYSHTHTLMLMSKLTAVSCYRNAWLLLLSLSMDMFSLTTGHFIIVKHTDIEQQTHVLDRSLGTTRTALGQIFPHSAVEWKKSLGKSIKLIFSLLPWTPAADIFYSQFDCTFSRRPCHSTSPTQMPKPLPRLLLPRCPPCWGLVNLYGDATA